MQDPTLLEIWNVLADVDMDAEPVSGVTDNLEIAVMSYYMEHPDRPEDDEEEEDGSSSWSREQYALFSMRATRAIRDLYRPGVE